MSTLIKSAGESFIWFEHNESTDYIQHSFMKGNALGMGVYLVHVTVVLEILSTFHGPVLSGL